MISSYKVDKFVLSGVCLHDSRGLLVPVNICFMFRVGAVFDLYLFAAIFVFVYLFPVFPYLFPVP